MPGSAPPDRRPRSARDLQRRRLRGDGHRRSRRNRPSRTPAAPGRRQRLLRASRPGRPRRSPPERPHAARGTARATRCGGPAGARRRARPPRSGDSRETRADRPAADPPRARGARTLRGAAVVLATAVATPPRRPSRAAHRIDPASRASVRSHRDARARNAGGRLDRRGPIASRRRVCRPWRRHSRRSAIASWPPISTADRPSTRPWRRRSPQPVASPSGRRPGSDGTDESAGSMRATSMPSAVRLEPGRQAGAWEGEHEQAEHQHPGRVPLSEPQGREVRWPSSWSPEVASRGGSVGSIGSPWCSRARAAKSSSTSTRSPPSPAAARAERSGAIGPVRAPHGLLLVLGAVLVLACAKPVPKPVRAPLPEGVRRFLTSPLEGLAPRRDGVAGRRRGPGVRLGSWPARSRLAESRAAALIRRGSYRPGHCIDRRGRVWSRPARRNGRPTRSGLAETVPGLPAVQLTLARAFDLSGDAPEASRGLPEGALRRTGGCEARDPGSRSGGSGRPSGCARRSRPVERATSTDRSRGSSDGCRESGRRSRPAGGCRRSEGTSPGELQAVRRLAAESPTTGRCNGDSASSSSWPAIPERGSRSSNRSPCATQATPKWRRAGASPIRLAAGDTAEPGSGGRAQAAADSRGRSPRWFTGSFRECAPVVLQQGRSRATSSTIRGARRSSAWSISAS